MRGGGNAMITVLSSALIDLQTEYQDERRMLPEVLYLRLDTCKDTKNKAQSVVIPAQCAHASGHEGVQEG